MLALLVVGSTVLLAGMLGIMIFLITALDHPYLGDVSVTPDAYQLVLDKVMTPDR